MTLFEKHPISIVHVGFADGPGMPTVFQMNHKKTVAQATVEVAVLPLKLGDRLPGYEGVLGRGPIHQSRRGGYR